MLPLRSAIAEDRDRDRTVHAIVDDGRRRLVDPRCPMLAPESLIELELPYAFPRERLCHVCFPDGLDSLAAVLEGRRSAVPVAGEVS